MPSARRLGTALVALTAALVALTAALVGAPGAHALPGDPPIVLLSPADGQPVAANAGGVPVSFACPDYHPSAADPGLVYGPSQYRVRFDESPAPGPDGLLGDSYDSQTADNAGGPNCSALLDALGSGPEVVGGRVYWQVLRSVSGGVEASAVRSFVVVAQASSATLKVPSRIWGGYQGLYNVKLAATLPGATVQLQRRSGWSWKTVASRRLDPKDTDLVGTLSAGKRTIRVRIVTAASSFVAATRTVTVRRARGGSRGSGYDGSYRGRAAGERDDQRLIASGGGRTIRSFFARYSVFCLPSQTMASTTSFKRLRVAPDGSVVGHRQTANEFELVTGRLTKGRFRGSVELQSPQCSGAGSLDLSR